MDEDFMTLEVEEEGCGRLQFELPLDVTDEEIAYIKSLVPRAESGLLELLDPDTGEVLFSCTPCWCTDQVARTPRPDATEGSSRLLYLSSGLHAGMVSRGVAPVTAQMQRVRTKTKEPA
jgi:hypothetical protein